MTDKTFEKLSAICQLALAAIAFVCVTALAVYNLCGGNFVPAIIIGGMAWLAFDLTKMCVRDLRKIGK